MLCNNLIISIVFRDCSKIFGFMSKCFGSGGHTRSLFEIMQVDVCNPNVECVVVIENNLNRLEMK